uniref:Uncharacterized protein n=1 Tax=Lactuca sativa TaxID=4236 RepID=A0A9R1XU39_LACSA|nr:hypothetical protein LSAT_V11C300132670 [Lactuca sativa]
MTENTRSDLYVALPVLSQGKKWVLLYSMDDDDGDGEPESASLCNPYGSNLGVLPPYCTANCQGSQSCNGNLTHLDAQLLETKSGISNRLSHNQSSVSAIICSGLFPGIASVVHRETSMSFKTIDDVQVLLYAFFSYVGGGEVQD